MRRRTRRRTALWLGYFVILGCLPLVGCGGSSTETGPMNTNTEEVKAQQDAMRGSMEQAYSRPDAKKGR